LCSVYDRHVEKRFYAKRFGWICKKIKITNKKTKNT